MPGELHTHEYKGVTTYANGHVHLFSGVSGVSPNVPGHTHTIAGQTAVSDGHSHPYRLISEGPVYVARVQYKHYHYYSGVTGFVRGHEHLMSGTTFVLGE